MGQMDRHLEIAEKIATLLRTSIKDAKFKSEVVVKDYNENDRPTRGITVAPEAVKLGMGTSARDDLIYSIMVIRTTHSMGGDDHKARLALYQDLRLMLHHKRLVITDTCHAYSTIDSTRIAIPESWQKENNSILIVRVNVTVRESRIKE